MSDEAAPLPKGSLKHEIIFWIILLIPFLYLPFIWDRLPDSIPTHWNLRGEPDDYSSKEFGALFLPLLNVAIYLLLLVVPKIDPRKLNYLDFAKTYRIIRLILAVFLLLIYFMTMQWSLGNARMNSKGIFMLMFGLFALLGYFMPSIRSNFFIGIRTPWTLDNSEVWKKTHEISGKLWCYASLAALGITFFISEEWMTWLLIPYLSVIAVFPIVYSYLLFRKINSSPPNQ